MEEYMLKVNLKEVKKTLLFLGNPKNLKDGFTETGKNQVIKTPRIVRYRRHLVNGIS